MKRIAPFLVLLAGILWGMIGIFVRRLNVLGFGSMEIVTLRAITTTCLLFVFLFFYDRNKLKIKIRDVWCFLGTGIFSIVFFNYCYFKAITLTSLSIAAILLYTAPGIVILLSGVLFHERITRVKMLSLLATFFGCALVTGVFTDGGRLNVLGILLGLCSGLGYALYSVFSRFALERGYDSLTISFYTFLFAMVGTIPLCNTQDIIKICFGDFNILVFCFVFGLVSTVIPYIAYTMGLKEMENGRACIIASIEPVTATFLGIVAYQESVTMNEWIGALFVLGAIILNNAFLEKEK